MFEYIILGIAQGIFEWLPVSSEGIIVLLSTNLFGSSSFAESIRLALFLHFGTLLAALVYFRNDVIMLFTELFKLRLKRYDVYSSKQKTLIFLIISTLLSGILGLFLITFLFKFEESVSFTGKIVTLVIGLLLLVTGYIELSAKKPGLRSEKDLKLSDGIILGITQGFASLPGLSRSGLTISALLLKNINKTTSLKLSFLMSIPIVLLANILINLQDFSISTGNLIGMVVSFVVGLLTIHILLKLSRAINFGLFVIAFGLLTIAASIFT